MRAGSGAEYASVSLLSLDDAASSAEVIGDGMFRSLDAIRLATARGISSELTALVC